MIPFTVQDQDSDKPNVTALYIRVSTQEQKIEGFGLESQRQALERYIERNEALDAQLSPANIFVDTHTGKYMQRPAFRKLCEKIKEGKIDTVMVWKLDRLSRIQEDLLWIYRFFNKNGVGLVSLMENMNFTGATGKFMFAIYAAVVEFDYNNIQIRTARGRITSAEMGNFTGTSIPFGYMPVKNENGKGKKLEIVPEERDWVIKIFNWYVYEEMGFGTVANELNDLNVPKGIHKRERDKGGKWTARIIEKMIKNPLYRGIYVANKKDINGRELPANEWTVVQIPPCVDEFLFALAQRKLKERKGKRKNTGHIYLLSGKITDVSNKYNRKFVGIPRKKGGRSYRRKQFTGKDGIYYGVFEIPAEVAETTVWSVLKEALENPKDFVSKDNIRFLRDHKDSDSIKAKLNINREKMVMAELEQDKVRKAFELGLYNNTTAESRFLEVQSTLEGLRNEKSQLEEKADIMAKRKGEIDGLYRASEQLKDNIDDLDRKAKKRLIDTFIESIEVNRTELENPSGKRKKWDRRLDVRFRFNHEVVVGKKLEGRTQNPLGDGLPDPLIEENGQSGGRGDGGLHKICVRFEFVKVFLNHDKPGRTWRIGLKQVRHKPKVWP